LAEETYYYNQKFYDIVNQEDWEIDVDVDEEPIIVRQFIFIGDLPENSYIVPTQIPGVWLNINLGFDVEEGDDNAW
tara:strand:+ start:339 stop:566 length:228 start_codon:yes stop_codon:yes gene_type:complete